MPTCPKCGHSSSELGGKCPYDEFYFVHDEAVTDARRDPLIGTIIADKYIIVSMISEGGMGAVYRALQTPIGREVALKVLRQELRDSEQGGDRFIREAKAVARLQHPNIINLHDFGFDDLKHPYMVMEYAPGLSLAKWLKTEKLTFERILYVTKQVLSALHEAHERGIVHRDLKPENMIIVKSGTDKDFVKLLDFGIARVINEGATRGLTREGEVFGTPHYMAPEQARGDKNIGPPADVYAVGIMLFEMLTGAQPFDAPTPLAVLFQHINEPLPPVTARPGVVVPDAITEILRTATAKEVRDRYQSAAEFLKALELTAPSGNMQAVLSAVIQDSLNPNTLAPGSRPLGTQQIPGRTPMNSPVGMQGGVAIYDPDPSVEQRRPYADQTVHDQPAAGGSKQTVVLLAGVVVTLAVLVGIVVYALNIDNGDPVVAEVPVTQTAAVTAEQAPPQVAKIDEKKPEQVNPAADTKVVDETNTPAEVTPTAVVEPKTEAKPADTPAVDKPAEKTSTKKTSTTTKKVEPKATTTVENKTETKTETKTEPKKDDKASPMKFAPVDTRKW